MTRAVMEGWVGGKVYSEQEDGETCPWGKVLLWEPPQREVGTGAGSWECLSAQEPRFCARKRGLATVDPAKFH